MIDAYLEALPHGRAPSILASRTVFVADDREEAMRLAEIGLVRQRARYERAIQVPAGARSDRPLSRLRFPDADGLRLGSSAIGGRGRQVRSGNLQPRRHGDAL